MNDLESMGIEVHRMAVAKGWWDNSLSERIPRLFDWLREEIDEAEKAWVQSGVAFFTTRDAEGLAKPEGLGSELADIYLIVADIAQGLHIGLPSAVRTKLDYDLVRKYKRDKAGNFPGNS